MGFFPSFVGGSGGGAVVGFESGRPLGLDGDGETGLAMVSRGGVTVEIGLSGRHVTDRYRTGHPK